MIFASTAPATPSSSLFSTPSPSAAIDGAGELPDAAEHDDHERVDDVALAEVGPDVADLATARSRPARRCRRRARTPACRRCAVSTPTQAAMRAVLRHAAHEQAEPRARDQQRHGQQHQRREHDDRDAVVRQHQVARHRDAARQPRRVLDLHVLRAEDRAHRLHQHQADAPGGEQRLERPAVQQADHAALEHRADRRRRRRTRPASRPRCRQSNAPGA